MIRLPPVPGEPVPAWGAGELVERDCFLCGSVKRETLCVRPDGLEVVRCVTCGAGYLPLAPSAGQQGRFYAGYSEKKRYLRGEVGRRGSGIGRALRRIFVRPQITPFVEILARTGGVAGQAVVEIGPGGQGGVLHEVRRLGGEPIAVEVDPVAAGRLRSAGIEVHADAREISGSVDVVVASMVLEHVADPRSLLRALAGCCRPGARLLASVPNAGQATVLGPAWVGFRVDLEHLNYFDAQTLARLLGEVGFLPECWWESAQPVLPAYQALADRRVFFAEMRSRLGRAAFAPADPMAMGSFQLSMLARTAGDA